MVAGLDRLLFSSKVGARCQKAAGFNSRAAASRQAMPAGRANAKDGMAVSCKGAIESNMRLQRRRHQGSDFWRTQRGGRRRREQRRGKRGRAGVRLRSTDKGPGNPQPVPLAVSVRSSAPGVMESAAAQITQCSQPLASL